MVKSVRKLQANSTRSCEYCLRQNHRGWRHGLATVTTWTVHNYCRNRTGLVPVHCNATDLLGDSAKKSVQILPWSFTRSTHRILSRLVVCKQAWAINFARKCLFYIRFLEQSGSHAGDAEMSGRKRSSGPKNIPFCRSHRSHCKHGRNGPVPLCCFHLSSSNELNLTWIRWLFNHLVSSVHCPKGIYTAFE